MAATRRVAVSNEVLDLKIDNLGARVGGCEDTLKDVAKNLGALGRLEERFASYLESDRDKASRITANEIKIDVLQGQIAPLLDVHIGRSKLKETYVVAILGFAGLLAAQVIGTWVTTRSLSEAVVAQRQTTEILAAPPAERPRIFDAEKKQ